MRTRACSRTAAATISGAWKRYAWSVSCRPCARPWPASRPGLTALSGGARMRIGIDARFLMHGVGRYVEELLSNLADLGGTHDYSVFTSRSYPNAPSLNHLWDRKFQEISGRGTLYSASGHVRIPY